MVLAGRCAPRPPWKALRGSEGGGGGPANLFLPRFSRRCVSAPARCCAIYADEAIGASAKSVSLSLARAPRLRDGTSRNLGSRSTPPPPPLRANSTAADAASIPPVLAKFSILANRGPLPPSAPYDGTP